MDGLANISWIELVFNLSELKYELGTFNISVGVECRAVSSH